MSKVRFIKSAPSIDDCPDHGGKEVALVGRSNAGKSALINALAKQKALARVSQRPGKTEYLNIYQLEPDFYLVDTPGYGYASRGEAKRQEWSPMIAEYLQNRQHLKGVILVVDSAREWSPQEEDLVEWLSLNHRPVLLAVTKMDRLNQKEMAGVKRRFASLPGLVAIEFISAQKGVGIESLRRTVFENLLRS